MVDRAYLKWDGDADAATGGVFAAAVDVAGRRSEGDRLILGSEGALDAHSLVRVLHDDWVLLDHDVVHVAPSILNKTQKLAVMFHASSSTQRKRPYSNSEIALTGMSSRNLS